MRRKRGESAPQLEAAPDPATSNDEALSFVVFEVADTGIGMSPEQLQRLFQMFTQGDDLPTRQFDGAGIGLALGQRLCRLLGGSIVGVSQPKQGRP
jgi:signal transduction histidine kinase